jgi:hypothetical protein
MTSGADWADLTLVPHFRRTVKTSTGGEGPSTDMDMATTYCTLLTVIRTQGKVGRGRRGDTATR